MRWRWLLVGVIAALAGTAAILGARLGQVRAERDALQAQERASESQIGKLSAEILALKTRLNEMTPELDNYKQSLGETNRLLSETFNNWQAFAAPKKLAVSAFEPLRGAEGVIIHDGSPVFTRTGSQVERAVSLLAGALPLGPASPPPVQPLQIRVEFVGVEDGTVLLTPNIAYFRGEGYYYAQIGQWFGTMMNAN